jgi:hypothetical protein
LRGRKAFLVLFIAVSLYANQEDAAGQAAKGEVACLLCVVGRLLPSVVHKNKIYCAHHQ